MSEFFKLLVQTIGASAPTLLILIVIISILHRLLSNVPIWDFLLNKSKRKTQLLSDQIEAFKIIEDNLEDKTLLPYFKKELQHKLLTKYLNIKIQPKKFKTLLSLYSNSERLKNNFDTKSFFHYSHSFKNDEIPCFSNRINIITIWIYSLLMFLLLILFLKVNPVLSDTPAESTLDYFLPKFEESPLSIKEKWYLFWILIGFVVNYFAIKISYIDAKKKRIINKIIALDALENDKN